MRNLHRLKKDASSADNSVKLIIGGREYFKILKELIDHAEHFLFFQTYIFASDDTGTLIQKALIKASKRGVKIYLLLDAFGSGSLPKGFIDEMTLAGIEFRFYGHFFSQWAVHLSRRMHHKVVVVDGFYSLVGGINVSDNYNDIPGKPGWLDFAVLCHGPVSMSFLLLCLRKWRRKRLNRIPSEYIPESKNNFKLEHHQCFVYARENDPLLNKQQISATYKRAFRSAENEIIIVGAYFIPGYSFRRLMKQAVKRGVTIKVITGSDSDIGLAKNARRFLYNWMLRNGLEIYEYQKSPVHGKVAVIDKEWVTIGSYDINNLSAYSNIELNVDIINKSFAAHFHNELLEIINKDCIKITSAGILRTYHWWNQFRLWASYRIVRFAFWLSQILILKPLQKRTEFINSNSK